MAKNKHVKSGSTSLVIKGMQLNYSEILLHTHIKMAKIKKTDNTKC